MRWLKSNTVPKVELKITHVNETLLQNFVLHLHLLFRQAFRKFKEAFSQWKQRIFQPSNNRGEEIIILSLWEVNLMERIVRRDCKTSHHGVNNHIYTLNNAVSKPLEQINNGNNCTRNKWNVNWNCLYLSSPLLLQRMGLDFKTKESSKRAGIIIIIIIIIIVGYTLYLGVGSAPRCNFVLCASFASLQRRLSVNKYIQN